MWAYSIIKKRCHYVHATADRKKFHHVGNLLNIIRIDGVRN